MAVDVADELSRAAILRRLWWRGYWEFWQAREAVSVNRGQFMPHLMPHPLPVYEYLVPDAACSVVMM